MPAHAPRSRRSFLGGLGTAAAVGLIGARPVAAAAPERALSLHHVCTGETVRTVYFADGSYQADGLRSLERLLRDWRTDQVIPFDPAVLDIVYRLQRRLEVQGPIEVLCGYRTPATNAMLRRQNHDVARNSLHMHGMAIDLRVPGRDAAQVSKAALALAAGGVGYYPAARFVHLDSGPVRHWVQDGDVAAGSDGGVPHGARLLSPDARAQGRTARRVAAPAKPAVLKEPAAAGRKLAARPARLTGGIRPHGSS